MFLIVQADYDDESEKKITKSNIEYLCMPLDMTSSCVFRQFIFSIYSKCLCVKVELGNTPNCTSQVEEILFGIIQLVST